MIWIFYKIYLHGSFKKKPRPNTTFDEGLNMMIVQSYYQHERPTHERSTAWDNLAK